MELNQIPQNPNNWGNVADLLNENSGKIEAETAKLNNVTTKFKGYFTTSTALSAKWPSPLVGDTAWVGATYPGVIYRCDVAGAWLATTDVPPSNTVNLSEYATQDAVSNEFASVRSDLSAVSLLSANMRTYDAGVIPTIANGTADDYKKAAIEAVPDSLHVGGMTVLYSKQGDTAKQSIFLPLSSWSTSVEAWENVPYKVADLERKVDTINTDIYGGLKKVKDSTSGILNNVHYREFDVDGVIIKADATPFIIKITPNTTKSIREFKKDGLYAMKDYTSDADGLITYRILTTDIISVRVNRYDGDAVIVADSQGITEIVSEHDTDISLCKDSIEKNTDAITDINANVKGGYDVVKVYSPTSNNKVYVDYEADKTITLLSDSFKAGVMTSEYYCDANYSAVAAAKFTPNEDGILTITYPNVTNGVYLRFGSSAEIKEVNKINSYDEKIEIAKSTITHDYMRRLYNASRFLDKFIGFNCNGYGVPINDIVWFNIPDVHERYEGMNDMIQSFNENPIMKSNAFCFVSEGDVFDAGTQSIANAIKSAEKWNDETSKLPLPLLFNIGGHDFYNHAFASDTAEQLAKRHKNEMLYVFNKKLQRQYFIDPCIGRLGDKAHINDNVCYYYVDDSAQNHRYVMLDECDTPMLVTSGSDKLMVASFNYDDGTFVDTEGNSHSMSSYKYVYDVYGSVCYQQAQLQWLINTLKASDGKFISLFNHSGNTQLSSGVEPNTQLYMLNNTPRVMFYILLAFINRTTYTYTSDSSLYGASDVPINISADFTKSTGVITGLYYGHIHYATNAIVKNSSIGDKGINCVSFAKTSHDSSAMGYTNKDSMFNICMDAVCINSTSKLIRTIRYGIRGIEKGGSISNGTIKNGTSPYESGDRFLDGSLTF